MGQTTDKTTTPESKHSAEPTWEIARLFPNQGHWSEEEYLALDTNRLVEFTDGTVEVLPMPTMTHQLVMLFLYRALLAFVSGQQRGTVLVAPIRVRLWPGKFREPDIVFMSADHANRMGNSFWDSADLVMEVVSADDPQRDWEIKRREYAQAGIPEYWIVDPQQGCIVVLWLEGDQYIEHGRYERGQSATSRLLPGFEVDVTAALSGRA